MVAVVGTRVEAEMIVGMLRSNGVQASVSADDAGGMEMPLQAQGVRVLVPDGEADEARRLLAPTGRDRPETAEPNAFQRWVVRVLGGRTSRS